MPQLGVYRTFKATCWCFWTA